MDKLKKKIALYKTVLALTVGSAVGTGVAMKDYNSNQETLAEVPSVLRYELYNRNIIDVDLLGPYNPNSIKVDKNITYEALENLLYTVIDLSLSKDINYIDKCPNLDTITVMNAERLTKEQILKINNHGCRKVVLYFNDIEIHKEDKLDLSLFNNKDQVLIHFYPIDELEGVTFYNYLENKECKNVEIDIIDQFGGLEYIRVLDNRLNEIISDIGIYSEDLDYDKVLKISKYIMDKIDYDEVVGAYLAGDKSKREEESKLASYYNDYDLTSVIFTPNNNVSGVCINYANLFDILCYKTGVKCRQICGYNRNGHAWNVLYLDDNAYFVDLTNADTDYLNKYITNYLETSNTTHQELINKLLFKPTTSYEGYTLNKSVTSLDTESEVIEVNYNVGLDGKKVMNDDFDKKPYINIGIEASIAMYLLLQYISMTLEARRARLKAKSFKYEKDDSDILDLDNEEVYKRLMLS